MSARPWLRGRYTPGRSGYGAAMTLSRRPLVLLAVLLTACAVPAAAANDGDDTPPEVQTESYGGGGTTTTTHKPHETTTTEKHDTTTTTEKATTTTATTTPREVTTTTHAATTTTAAATTTTHASTTTSAPSHKVFVCKYVGTPGVDERLQTGQNPISVDVHSLNGPPVIGQFFQDRQGRSVVIAFDVGQPEPDVSACPSVTSTTTTTIPKTTTTTVPRTTTTVPRTTTTAPRTTTTTTPRATTTTTTPRTTTTAPRTTTTTTTPGGGGGTTTTTIRPPTPGLFSVPVVPVCPPNGVPSLSITFGNRPDLNGQTGTLTFDGGSPTPLVFQSNTTVTIPWPAGRGTIGVVSYTVNGETATAGPVEFPEGCTTTTTSTSPTTTTTTVPATSTTRPTTTIPGVTTTSTAVTTTTIPGTTTTLPATFQFGAATTVCSAEVPTIQITFVSPAQFPALVGQTGTLTMRDVNGNVVSVQPLVYQPGTTVSILYPGTAVNPDGSIADVPGWILQPNGLWVRDPSDEFLREGIALTYELNPTATAFVTYPPESANCANPDNPPRPPTPRTPGTPGSPGLPKTGSNTDTMTAVAFLALGAGSVLVLAVRRRR